MNHMSVLTQFTNKRQEEKKGEKEKRKGKERKRKRMKLRIAFTSTLPAFRKKVFITLV